MAGPDPASVLSGWNRMARVDNGTDSISGGETSTRDDADNQKGNEYFLGCLFSIFSGGHEWGSRVGKR